MTDHRSIPTLVGIIRELSSRVAALEGSNDRIPTYTVATRPSASAVTAPTIIFVSDAGAGSQFQGSDGTTWRTLG